MTKPLPDIKVLVIKHKHQSYCVVINRKQWGKLKKHAWHIHFSRGNKKRVGEPYARATIGKKKVYLHRFLTGAYLPMHVDHKNHCTLDCRDDNLEVITNEENQKRRRKKHKRVVDKNQITLPLAAPPPATTRSITECLRP